MPTSIAVNNVLLLTTELNLGFDNVENAIQAAKFASKNDPTIVECEVVVNGQVEYVFVNGEQVWSLATNAFI